MMKAFWTKLAITTAITGAVLFLKASRTQATNPPSNRETDCPPTCNALALSPEERTRHFDQLEPALGSLKKGVRELDNGYEFEFPGDQTTLQVLAEWAIQERECCPFFEIDLRLESERGAAWLRLTGRKGTKDLLRISLAGWLRS